MPRRTATRSFSVTLRRSPPARTVQNVGYDPRKDLAPIGLIASAPALLLVYKDLPVHNVGELIALMKSRKEPYQVATPGTGTVNYLASILFAQQAGRQRRADHRERLGSADHGYDGRLRQSRLQSNSGVARRRSTAATSARWP